MLKVTIYCILDVYFIKVDAYFRLKINKLVCNALNFIENFKNWLWSLKIYEIYENFKIENLYCISTYTALMQN